MIPEELTILRETIDSLREGTLTDSEKVIFIIGIQAGLYSGDKTIKELLNKVADICLNGEDKMLSEIKEFND